MQGSKGLIAGIYLFKLREYAVDWRAEGDTEAKQGVHCQTTIHI